MKTLIVLLMLATFQAKAQYREILQHSKTITMNVALNEKTVLCSKADYGALFLKILIPDLASHTLLNHRNLGASAPCVAAGSCTDDNNPSKIIDAAKPIEKIAIKIDIYRAEFVKRTGNDFMPGPPGKQVCGIIMIERIETIIRGRKFTHQRDIELGSRELSDCTLDLSKNLQ